MRAKTTTRLTESSQVGKARMSTNGDIVLFSELDGCRRRVSASIQSALCAMRTSCTWLALTFVQRHGVRGVEAARHVGHIDVLHQLLVRAQLPPPERLAHIRVDLPTRGDFVSDTFQTFRAGWSRLELTSIFRGRALADMFRYYVQTFEGMLLLR
jgi:hypothetical protein